MGVLLLLLSAAGFGALGVFGKLSFDAGVGIVTLLTVRFAMASVGFGVLTAVVRVRAGGRGSAPRMSRRLALTAFVLGCVGYAAQSGLFFGALAHIDLSLLSLILYMYPAFVTLAAIALGRDPVTRRRLVALGAASVGVALVLVGAGGGEADAIGIAMGVGAALAYTTYILIADTVIAAVPPIPFSATILLGAFLSTGTVGLVSGSLDFGFDAAGWGWLAAMSVVSTIVPVLAFFAGLRRVGASNAAILSTCEPPITVVLALLVFGEHLGPVQLAGGALVLSAVVLLQLGGPSVERSQVTPAPERMPHPVAG